MTYLGWLIVILCVLSSTGADSLSTYIWKSGKWYLLAVLVPLATCVFILFGYIGSKLGLSLASCLTNSLIVIGPVVVGLIIFKESKHMNPIMYVFMGMILLGIIGIVITKQYAS